MIATAKREFNRDGYAVIKGVFDAEEISNIRSEAYRIWGHSEESARQYSPTGRPALVFWPQNLSHYLDSIAKDPRLKTIVHAFLGVQAYQLNNQVYYREGGDGDQFAWHQDICFRTPESDFDRVEDGYLQTVIAVDKMDAENGAIEFIPGSHCTGNQQLIPRDGTEAGLRNFVRNGRHGVKVEAEPGDVLLWHVLTVHGSEPNFSQRSRMTYMNGFAKTSAVLNKERFPIYNSNW